jgi:hypothetical protein
LAIDVVDTIVAVEFVVIFNDDTDDIDDIDDIDIDKID